MRSINIHGLLAVARESEGVKAVQDHVILYGDGLRYINGFAFPNSYMCNSCQDTGSCNRGFDYCEFTYRQTMESKFKEEMSIFYVAITRAKKDVFFTVNTGVNKWNYVKTISCLLNLEGLTSEDYEWENVI